MATLLTVYSICFGVGLLYVLIAGALGLHGGAGHDVGGGGGGHDFGGHELAAGHAGHGDAGGGGEDAQSQVETVVHGPAHAAGVDYNPFNLLSIMCFLAAFGGSGLIASALHVPLLLSFPLALAGGFFVAWLLYLLLTRVLLVMQTGSAPGEEDMLGLDAEVLTPIEEGHFGEIAYVLRGARYTAPAKLLRGGTAGRSDAVRIVKMDHGTAYVEVRRKLLD
jgi:membrane protein implicated in regulation of membrane protease activity